MFESTKTKNVFKSRWNALFWSLSVMLTAYCTIPDAEDSSAPDAAESATVAAAAPTSAPTRWDKPDKFQHVSTEHEETDIERAQHASDRIRNAIH
jgi:hypothetical protein